MPLCKANQTTNKRKEKKWMKSSRNVITKQVVRLQVWIMVQQFSFLSEMIFFLKLFFDVVPPFLLGDAVVLEVGWHHLYTEPIRRFGLSSLDHQIDSAPIRWQPNTCSMVSICKSCRNQRACDTVAEAGASLGASSTDVVSHIRVLASRAVQVGYRPWAVGTWEASRTSWVSPCT